MIIYPVGNSVEAYKMNYRVFTESSNKREKIWDSLKKMEVRLKEMEKDCAELKEYQKLRKEKRGLQFAVYDRDLKGTRKTLDEVSFLSVLI